MRDAYLTDNLFAFTTATCYGSSLKEFALTECFSPATANMGPEPHYRASGFVRWPITVSSKRHGPRESRTVAIGGTRPTSVV